MLGAPPRGRSHRKIAIHPLSFGRNQSSSGWPKVGSLMRLPRRGRGGGPELPGAPHVQQFICGGRHAGVLRCLPLRGSQTRPVKAILEICTMAQSSSHVSFACLHRCPTRSRSSRGDLLAQLWRSCPLALCAFASAPAPIGCIDRCHQLAVISSQSLPGRPNDYDIMSLGRSPSARSHIGSLFRLVVTGCRDQLAVISQSSARSHWLAVTLMGVLAPVLARTANTS